jgi:1,3-beta-glucanosyltransferase GAS1
VDIVKGKNVSVRPEFLALSSQLDMVHPSTTMMDQYTPTNTAPSSCSPLTWEIRTINASDGSTSILTGETTADIPHAPSARLCGCMMETLQCISNQTDPHDDSIISKHCENSFDNVLCLGVTDNYTTGIFGTYTGCNVMERQSWILNQIFVSKEKDPGICSSVGGITNTPVPMQSRAPDCDAYIRQAGTDATGRITYTPIAASMNTIAAGHTLETGTRAGIAVGVTMFILLLAAVISGVYIFLKRRRAIQKSDDFEFSKPELPDTSKGPIETPDIIQLDSSQKYELTGHIPQEMEGEAKIEMDTATQIHELKSEGNEVFELDGTSNTSKSKSL